MTLPEQLPALPAEQVFDAVTGVLLSASADALIAMAPALAEVIPELKPMIGFDQHSPHHAYDVFTHTALVVAAVPAEPALRWAALLHDVGKIPAFTQDENGRGHFKNHAGIGADMADGILQRLKAPAALRARVVFLVRNHMTRLHPEKDSLRSRLELLGEETILQLLALQEADMRSKGRGEPRELEQFVRIRAVLKALRAEAF